MEMTISLIQMLSVNRNKKHDKTMKTIYFILISITVVLCGLTACTDSNDTWTVASSSPRFVLGTMQSRVTYPTVNYTHSVFEKGDVLGAFAIDENNNVVGTSNARYRVVTEEGSQTLEPELTQDAFPANTDYTYIFYYPFKEGTAYKSVTHMVEADQRTEALYERSDLLWDVAKGSSETNGILTVNVEMEHAMSHIILEVPTEMLYETEPCAQMLSVKSLVSGINLLTESSDNPTGSMGETVLSQNIYMWWFTEADIDGKQMYVYRAVIPAQTIANGTEMFSIQTGENEFKTYTASFSNNQIEFKTGKYYRFTVTETGLRFRGLIEDLENGGDYYYEY